MVPCAIRAPRGVEHPHAEVQLSYAWAGAEAGGWILILISAYQALNPSDALGYAMLIIEAERGAHLRKVIGVCRGAASR
jgi:hypothetical protein